MIAFRVDANNEIATGHLFRCLSVAEHIINNGEEVLFIMSNGNCKSVLDNRHFGYIILDNDYKDKDSEINVIKDIITNRNIKLIFIDSYQATNQYLNALSELVPVAYIDDLLSLSSNVRVRIRPKYGCTIDEFTDKNIDINNSLMLIGSSYVPLRSAFSKKIINIRERVRDIFITTGGTDNLNVINTIINNSEVLMNEAYNKHIVVGAYYKHMDELMALVEKCPNISVYQNISNIDEIMSKCDVGISAGGTTLAELCACGVATLCFSIADNQMNGTKAYDKAGMMINCGDYRFEQAAVLENINNGLIKLINDYEYRKQMVEIASSKIDGKGAMRIAQELITICKKGKTNG